MANPYISLLQTAWRYARREKRRYILVYAMFIGANLVYAMNPILFGWFIGKVVKDSAHVLHYTLIYVGCYIGLKFLQ
ncbi:MAG TPA: hypothetical protein VHC96_07210, partial [Puia sp.]|nr:hypothetical protein [Puia sp.]